VIGHRAYELKQCNDALQFRLIAQAEGARADSEEDANVLREYFQLHLNLSDFMTNWRSRDKRFESVSAYYPGARLLRQDPLECLFSFICSSNNHISRIHGMVNKLCRRYGTKLVMVKQSESSARDAEHLFSFPSLEQLAEASEEELRKDGFGYRAKFIVGTVKQLREKTEGGTEWLAGLRSVPYREASSALMTLPGIGPKVAACVCLFSLDKFEAIPVDTHVWQAAVAHYRPDLEGKSLTPRLMTVVEDTLIERFGPHAGWAHNVLFLSELAQLKKKLPEKLQTPQKRKAKSPAKAKSPTKAMKKKKKGEAY